MARRSAEGRRSREDRGTECGDARGCLERRFELDGAPALPRVLHDKGDRGEDSEDDERTRDAQKRRWRDARFGYCPAAAEAEEQHRDGGEARADGAEDDQRLCPELAHQADQETRRNHARREGGMGQVHQRVAMAFGLSRLGVDGDVHCSRADAERRQAEREARRRRCQGGPERRQPEKGTRRRKDPPRAVDEHTGRPHRNDRPRPDTQERETELPSSTPA
jgi:hypothetical protein